MVHAGLALFKIPARRTFLKTRKNILVPKNYFLCAKFISRSVILTNFKWKEIYPGREMYCLIMHITPKKKTLYIKTWIKTTTLSTPEHSYICNAVPTFLKLSLINSNDEKKYTPSYLEWVEDGKKILKCNGILVDCHDTKHPSQSKQWQQHDHAFDTSPEVRQ